MRFDDTPSVLVGRARERAVIDRLLDGARGGTSGVLLLRGQAGIGKSALLDTAAGLASGLTVLRARGLESESELAFAGLHELVGPALELVDGLPEPQAVALRGALRLAPAEEIDRFAVYAATSGLLAAVAERGPVLVTIDDAHWLDGASADAIVFAARRLGAEGIVLLAALRDDAESPFLRPGFPELDVAPLGPTAARELLGDGVAPQVADRLVAAAGGNPLALRELAGGLGPDELAGNAPLAEPLPAGRSIEQAFARRLDALDAGERAALLVAAASESERLELIGPAASALGGGARPFEPAEAAGLVVIDGGCVRFRHPLLRSAIYGSAPAADRRAAHRALADEIPDERAHERAWHEAAATVLPDEAVAAALERTAEDALRRSGHAAAARALERAARLSPGDEDRARRLLGAARSARHAGLSWAAELLREAHGLTRDPLLRFDVELLQAAVEGWSGSVVSAARRYVDSADGLDPPDAERTVTALSYGAACLGVAGDIPGGIATARRAARLGAAAEVDESTMLLAIETLGSLLVENGATFEGRDFVLEAAAWYRRNGDADTAFVSLALIWLEEYDLARRLIEALVAAARRASDLRTLAAALELLAELEFRTGDWSTATTAAAESVRLADETGQTAQLAHSLAGLATVQAGRGDEACGDHAARAVDLGRRSGLGGIVAQADYALGLRDLGLGEHEAAISALERTAAYAAAAGQDEPGVVPWAPELCEAYVLARREPEAARAVEAFERQAESTGRVWARAAALRCRGLLVDELELDAPFAEALRIHAGTPAPFQLARTELAYGRRLRRARRRVDAREQLRRALATFERLGARPWAETARRELAASGETLRTATPAARDLLTPQELQIAQLVADGMTNREVAASLFLSPKTIESHLQNAYRKLGVHSRTQLAKHLAAGNLPA